MHSPSSAGRKIEVFHAATVTCWLSPSFSAGMAIAARVLELARQRVETRECPTPDADRRFNAAVDLYTGSHWERAFVSLAQLADEGHATAADLALLMLRYGSAVYGTNFVAEPKQIARWAQRVLRATSRPTASPNSITANA